MQIFNKNYTIEQMPIIICIKQYELHLYKNIHI
jgi:hypothetical protein